MTSINQSFSGVERTAWPVPSTKASRYAKIPDLFIPHPQSDDSLDAALADLTKRYEGSRFTVARLTWNDELWIEDGAERLAEKAAMDRLTAEDWAEIRAHLGHDE